MPLAVGVIGLGAMGNGMAQSLRRAGHAPQVFDVRQEVARAFAAEGGTACESLAQLGAQCDVVVSVVVNAARGLMLGPDVAADLEKFGVFNTSTGGYVIQSLAWIVVILAIFVPLSVRQFNKN